MKPAMVLTLWTKGKKPRPCVWEVPMASVKSFRAVTLAKAENDPSPGRFDPTESTWRYDPSQIVGILDVEKSDWASPEITLTADSIEALDKLDEEVATVQDLAEKQDKPQKKTSKMKSGPKFNAVHKLITKHTKAAAKAAAAKSQTKKDHPDEAVIVAADIRRSEAGRRKIKALVCKALEVETMKFDAPCFDATSGACALKGLSGLDFKDFLSRTPKYFQAQYWKINSPVHYGQRVFNDLEKILKDLDGEPPCRKSLESFIRSVAKVIPSTPGVNTM